jgi:anaerobic selenocysteine-containing dehydrogenase
MKVSRRDLLVGSAGVAAGLVFTPVPWKLLGDVSIWTQNWPWIPQAAHAPVETKQSVCTLCAAGCGIRVRMAAGWPVGISGVSDHPVTKGALCPLAFGAQQLNWHPQRLREVRHRGRAASWAEAKAAFEKACSEGPVAIVDGRPGRAASSIFEAFAAKHNGSYQVVLGPESRALLPYAEWSGVPVTALGYDLENTRTIVSFGAPLLDGWGTPGRFTRLWSEQAAGRSDPQLRLIQIEPSLSRTAARAWRWVPIHEGGEAALAAGLARVLFEERLTTAKGPVPQMTLADATTQTGLSVEAIRDLAQTIVANRPAVVITADANPAVAALNVLLGAVGAPGGIVLRGRRHAAPASPQRPNNSLRAMLIDATVPWEFGPQTGAEVFRFAAWDGGDSKADWQLPAPGFLEELTDVPTEPASPVETYAIAMNLLTPAAEIKSASQFLAQIDAGLPEIDKVIHTRCEELFRSRAGTVYAGKAVPVTQFESAQKLEEQLRKGGVWMGDAGRAGSLPFTLKQWPADPGEPQAIDWASSWALPVLPPLAGKLYQESDLREAPARRTA